MKLGVFWPWASPFAYTGFTENVVNLKRPEGYEVRFFRGDGWSPARRHTDGVEKALAWGADLILCIGSDQTYPEDMLVRLVNRYKETDGDVITALVPFRGYVNWQNMKPFQPLAWKVKDNNLREFRGMDRDSDKMEPINPANGDLQKVNVIGSGVLLFDRKHIESIKRPWFFEMIDKKTYRLIGDMDSQFIWRLQLEGKATVWVDTTIKVEHLSVFSIDESFQDRFDDWMEKGRGDMSVCRYGREKLDAGKNNT